MATVAAVTVRGNVVVNGSEVGYFPGVNFCNTGVPIGARGAASLACAP